MVCFQTLQCYSVHDRALDLLPIEINHNPHYILAGNSSQAPEKDYSVVGTPASKVFGVFDSLAIITTTFGNGIIPEIQVQYLNPLGL